MKVLKIVVAIPFLFLAVTAEAAPKFTNRVGYDVIDLETEVPVRRTESRKSVDPITVAKKYEGMHAYKDRATLKSLMDIDPATVAWCAGFVNAILEKAGLTGTDSLQARSFLNWGTATKTPKEGDVVIFTRGRSREAGHVGFYVGEEVVDGVRYILVLGGNQRKAVNVAYYPAQHVLGYRKIG
jgi:uncharacterized protein (TIGR02594 family)